MNMQVNLGRDQAEAPTVVTGAVRSSAMNDTVSAPAEPAPAVRVGRMSTATYATRPLDELDVQDVAGIQPFANSQERQAAFSNPQYRRDPNFRLLVNRRIAASIVAGIDK